MKGLVINTFNHFSVQEYGEPLYRTVGETVGGYIEVVHPKGLPAPYCMIVNEEGIIQELPVNLMGSILYESHIHGSPIVGNIVIMKTGIRNGEPDIVGLDGDEVAELVLMLADRISDYMQIGGAGK